MQSQCSPRHALLCMSDLNTLYIPSAGLCMSGAVRALFQAISSRSWECRSSLQQSYLNAQGRKSLQIIFNVLEKQIRTFISMIQGKKFSTY